MPTTPPVAIQFINRPRGTVKVGSTGVDLHWDIQERIAWLARASGGGKTFAADEEFEEIRGLWVAITYLTHAFVDQEPYPDAHLTLLNSWARKTNLVPALGNNGLIYSCLGFSDALTWVAVQAVYLLGEAKLGQIRKCQGCSTIFFDPSPTQRKKWCTMAKCGNKAKVREFNRRKKSGTSA